MPVLVSFLPRQGNVFTPVLDSVADNPPPPRQTASWADTPPLKEMTTAADGMHPTGIHSCWEFVPHKMQN